MLTVLMAPAVPAFAQAGPDNDGDGIANQQDLDDDNDGILDVNEGLVDANNDGIPDAGSTDTDGDGVPDVLDLDSDNDGVLDNLETRADRNAVKALDLNPNGAIDISFAVGANGIPDVIETSPDSGVLIYDVLDSDGDGSPDFRDTDSDNDGIFDITEAGGTDNNADGRIDSFSDSDGKGVDDAVQASALPLFDTDGDGSLDYRDADSDADGIPDAVESFGSSSANPTDTDNDGAADYRESDSDGDGVSDAVEAGQIPSQPADTNGDGRPDFQDAAIQNTGSGNGGGNNGGSNNGSNGGSTGINPDGPDTDGDGIANQFDLDDDNDGILDTTEGLIDANGDGVADGNSRDSDGDGVPDGWDLDSDNDGLLDNREAHPDFGVVSSLDQVVNGAIDISFAVGSNGIPDAIETSPDSGVLNFSLQDTDGDGTPDFMDIDSDADGITDLVEAGGIDADNNGRIDNFFDADAKGVDDTVQASALPVFDTDGDGTADYRDTDSDNDSLSDSAEAGDLDKLIKRTTRDKKRALLEEFSRPIQDEAPSLMAKRVNTLIKLRANRAATATERGNSLDPALYTKHVQQAQPNTCGVCPQQFNVPEEFEHELVATVRSSPKQKSPGPDGIANEMLQLCPELCGKVLFLLWKACGHLAYIPTSWREGTLFRHGWCPTLDRILFG